MSAARTTPRATAIALAIDTAAVIAFVALGRSSHDEGGAIGGTLKVAAPFLIALAAAWAVAMVPAVAARIGTDRWSPRFGVFAWVVTVAVGMALRRLAFGRGTAIAFVIVATLFVALFLVGWRALAAWLTARRAAAASSG